jgi:hypothetical protein
MFAAERHRGRHGTTLRIAFRRGDLEISHRASDQPIPVIDILAQIGSANPILDLPDLILRTDPNRVGLRPDGS